MVPGPRVNAEVLHVHMCGRRVQMGGVGLEDGCVYGAIGAGMR